MYIKQIHLNNFRNYNNLEIELINGVNVFTGDNAQGKTNILESIFYCSLGKSHRTNKDKEMIKWNKSEAYIKTYVVRERIDKKIEIKIFNEGKKGINVNTIKLKKMSELMGILNVVMFSPEDLKIVKESPNYRRKFLDIELCKLNPNYYYNLVQYNKVLNEKNIVLKNWTGGKHDMLDIYNRQLSKFGGYIIKKRIDYIKKLNDKGKIIHREITSNLEEIEFKYLTNVNNYNNIENELFLLYEKNIEKDIIKRNSSVGPQKDDFSITINGIDTRSYGSQGQQRTSILTIKFASLFIIKEDTGEYPVLLLDDVLSELDLNRQKYILNSLSNIQTIITCTGISEISKFLNNEYKLFSVSNGTIS